MCHQREWGERIPVAIGKEAVLPRGLPKRGRLRGDMFMLATAEQGSSVVFLSFPLC